MAEYCTVDGVSAIDMMIDVPRVGAWTARAELATDAPLSSSAVALRIGAWTARGTVRQRLTYASRSAVVVVGGAGAWHRMVAPRHYHSDGGVRAELVLRDAAAEVGEALAQTIAPDPVRVGVDYTRERGPASRALRHAIGSASWWVDYDGVTQVGRRVITDAAGYEVLSVSLRTGEAVLAVSHAGAVGVGSIVRLRDASSITVEALTLSVARGALRATVRGVS
jgi:hypothetical protein